MRIIFLTITFHPEPAIHGLPLAKSLAARGHEVKVLTTFPQYPIGRIYAGYRMRPWQWETIDGIRVLRVPVYPSHDNSAMRRMATYLSFAASAATVGAALIGPADVVYMYEPPPTNGVAALTLKVFRGMPVVHGIADMWPETVVESGLIHGSRAKSLAASVLGAWCRFLYRRAELITVLSPGFKRILIERGVPESKIRVIYNWADEAVYQPGKRDPALARELGFDGRFNILYAGNLGVYQALETVIEASSLIKTDPRIQVVIVGTGPKEEELKRLAQARGADNVLFLGRRQYWEMAKINTLADVLLIHLKDLPFMRTTIPGKTQVSLASGRPILMAVSGDAADIVRQAEAGVICAPEDPAAMAEAMRRMGTMPRAELERMAASGRRYYEQHLALEIAAEHFDKTFAEAVARRSARGRRKSNGRPAPSTCCREPRSGADGDDKGADLSGGHA
jgi:colanic acid biosynthesis glycosyl transferase WcaI